MKLNLKLKNLERDKMLNAISIFAEKVKNPYKLKIIKLLYFLDFKHYKETGQSVTYLKYYAWKMGPVPKQLFDELNNLNNPEFKKYFSILEQKINNNPTYKFISTKKYNENIFTPRELKIIKDLIFIYKEAKAEQMTEITHLKEQPWSKTIKEKGMSEEIDYSLVIDDESPISIEEAQNQYEEYLNMVSNYNQINLQ